MLSEGDRESADWATTCSMTPDLRRNGKQFTPGILKPRDRQRGQTQKTKAWFVGVFARRPLRRANWILISRGQTPWSCPRFELPLLGIMSTVGVVTNATTNHSTFALLTSTVCVAAMTLILAMAQGVTRLMAGGNFFRKCHALQWKYVVFLL